VADVDADGRLELLIATGDQYLYCYDTGASGDVLWGTFRGNTFNTGVQKTEIPTVEERIASFLDLAELHVQDNGSSCSSTTSNCLTVYVWDFHTSDDIKLTFRTLTCSIYVFSKAAQKIR
jgi:hypothetical protein